MSHPEDHDDPAAAVAALEHLTGPSRGSMTWLGEPMLDVLVDGGGAARVRPSPAVEPAGEPAPDVVARLRRVGGGHLIEAVGGRPLWVNRRQISSAQLLRDHDMIELCEHGPISRYFLYDGDHRIHQTVPGIFSDAVGYFRASRRPIGRRLMTVAGQVLRRVSRETTILFRTVVVLMLIVLAAVVYQQGRMGALLRSQIESGSARLEDISRILARTRDEALTPGHLESLRQELASRMTTTVERVSELERRSEAGARVIETAARSIVLLQGAYGFREAGTARMLRHVLGDDGRPLVLPGGLPLLSPDGDGLVAERLFTGTGFLVGDGDLLVTNRHVGAPWEHDASFALFDREGIEPVMIRFIAYLPGAGHAAAVELVSAGKEADVAVMRHEFDVGSLRGLPLSARPPVPGDEVIVMGYPTGLRSILAQAGEAFIKELQEAGETDFWAIAERLAAAGRIVPLASRGIVGRTTSESIVYDAATTSGGSGGPVLDVDGAVIAVNSAILPEYGGSNLGVPVDRVRELLADIPVN